MRLPFDRGAEDHPSPYLSLPCRDSVWTPDTFFRDNLDTSKEVMNKDNSFIRVFPDGRVLMSNRFL